MNQPRMAATSLLVAARASVDPRAQAVVDGPDSA
jgi:hypothetical protein